MIIDQKSNAKIIGVYLIGNGENITQIGVSYKPNLLRRFFTWVFIGWTWVTIESIKK